MSTLLKGIVDSSQGIVQLTKEPNAEGRFQFFTNGLNVYGHFDSDSKDFVLFGGPTADIKTFNSYLDQILAKRKDLYEFEQTFDSAGSGLAVWLDTAELWGLAGSMVRPELAAAVAALKIQDTEFLYLGTGAKEGAGSAKLHLQYAKQKETPFVFLPSNSVLEAQTGGKTNYVAVVPMLSKTNFDQLVHIESSFTQSDSLKSSFEEVNDIAKAELGADLTELLGAFGSSVAIVNDKGTSKNNLSCRNSDLI